MTVSVLILQVIINGFGPFESAGMAHYTSWQHNGTLPTTFRRPSAVFGDNYLEGCRRECTRRACRRERTVGKLDWCLLVHQPHGLKQQVPVSRELPDAHLSRYGTTVGLLVVCFGVVALLLSPSMTPLDVCNDLLLTATFHLRFEIGLF